jgi:lipopolysaccharide transport system ATP-binding protein
LFATATAFPADILLLDEWLSVVDEKFSAKAEQRLLKLVSMAAIVIIASHDQPLLRRTCTSIVTLDQGRIVGDDRPRIQPVRHQDMEKQRA